MAEGGQSARAAAMAAFKKQGGGKPVVPKGIATEDWDRRPGGKPPKNKQAKPSGKAQRRKERRELLG